MFNLFSMLILEIKVGGETVKFDFLEFWVRDVLVLGDILVCWGYLELRIDFEMWFLLSLKFSFGVILLFKYVVIIGLLIYFIEVGFFWFILIVWGNLLCGLKLSFLFFVINNWLLFLSNDLILFFGVFIWFEIVGLLIEVFFVFCLIFV